MFFFRIIYTALQSLRQNMLRTMLATLGVLIGVGAVVAAVSILEGSQKAVLGMVEGLGADQLMIVNGSDEKSTRRTRVESLLPKDAKLIKMENPDLIVAIAPQYSGGGQIKYYDNNTFVTVLGTTEAYSTINEFKVEHGRFISPQDILGKTMVCVLGYQVTQDLFGVLPAVGKRVKLNGKGFVVVGVMEEKGAMGFNDVDNQVIVPLSTAMGRLFGSRYLTVLGVQCVDAASVGTCIDKVKKTLRVSHRIRAEEGDDFRIFTQEQMKQIFGQVGIIFALVLYSIAGISIVVGAIGIMNIMLVSVTERTREIGVRIAVGARRFDIMRQFLTEASFISLIGGALGVGCGWAIANFLSKVTEVLDVYIRPSLIVSALVMAGVVGIVSGIYPAIRASRLDPVEALRFE